MLQIVGITTNFSKLVPKAPNSRGNAGGHFFHEAKNESCQKQKQLMPNDRSQQEKKKIPKDHVKRIKLWVYIQQKHLRFSGG